MGKPVLVLSSVTHAMKSRDILLKHGIKAYVERSPRTRETPGCGYGIYVPKRTQEAEEILKKMGIEILGRSERVAPQ